VTAPRPLGDRRLRRGSATVAGRRSHRRAPRLDVELIGDEVARLLAGETLVVRGYVAPAALVDEVPAELVEPVESEQLAEPSVPGGDETPEVPGGEYGPELDEPPAGTEPITRPAQVDPPQRGSRLR